MINREREREQLRQRAFGWSLACEEIFPGIDLGRDLRLVEGPNGLDLARVFGPANLTQALTIALTTRLGDDIFNIQFGFDGLNVLAEETNPILTRERIRVAVIQVLHQDPRVRRILDVKLTDGSSQLERPSAGSRLLDVRVAFETITGEENAVNLGRVISNG